MYFDRYGVMFHKTLRLRAFNVASARPAVLVILRRRGRARIWLFRAFAVASIGISGCSEQEHAGGWLAMNAVLPEDGKSTFVLFDQRGIAAVNNDTLAIEAWRPSGTRESPWLVGAHGDSVVTHDQEALTQAQPPVYEAALYALSRETLMFRERHAIPWNESPQFILDQHRAVTITQKSAKDDGDNQAHEMLSPVKWNVWSMTAGKSGQLSALMLGDGCRMARIDAERALTVVTKGEHKEASSEWTVMNVVTGIIEAREASVRGVGGPKIGVSPNGLFGAASNGFAIELRKLPQLNFVSRIDININLGYDNTRLYMAVSSDGRFVVYPHPTVIVWDVKQSKLTPLVKRKPNRFLLSGDNNQEAPAYGELLREQVVGTSFVGDGHDLIVVFGDGELQRWDLNAMQCIKKASLPRLVSQYVREYEGVNY